MNPFHKPSRISFRQLSLRPQALVCPQAQRFFHCIKNAKNTYACIFLAFFRRML